MVILAYIDAYTKLVGNLGGLSPDAKADAPSQAVTLARPGMLRATPTEKGKVLKPLDAGVILYPTGNKDGVGLEVADEVGNKGWVSQLSIANYRPQYQTKNGLAAGFCRQPFSFLVCG